MSQSRGVLQSTGFLLAVSLFQRSLGVVSTLILARLLTPEDFGIVAIAALVIHFSDILSNSGAQQYIAQVDKLRDNTINTAWTLDILLKFGAMALIYIALPFADRLWSDPDVIVAIAVLSPMILIRAFTHPELFVHRRELHYATVFRIGVLQKLVSFAVVVGVALTTRSFWAIIIGDLVGTLFGVLLSWRLCRSRPRFSLAELRTQWDFSKWMVSRGFIGYLRAQVDTLLVSQYFSLAAVGKFNLSRELIVMPALLVIMPALEPLIASYAKVRDDPPELCRQICLSLLCISLLVAPVSVFLFVYAEPVFLLLLGDQWQDVGGLVRALTPLLFVFAINGMVTNLFLALGRVRIVFVYDVLSLMLLFAAMVLVRDHSLTEFSWVRAMVGLGVTLIFLFGSMRLVGVSVFAGSTAVVLPLVLGLLPLAATTQWPGVITPLSVIPVGLLYGAGYVAAVVLTAMVLRSRDPSWRTLHDTGLDLIQRSLKSLRWQRA